jgi:hypothetical protein
VIAEPWIGKILRGEKSWEMRSRGCNIRGKIALIRKGSGQVVGTAELAGCLPPLTTAGAYAAAEPQHAIPPADQPRAFAGGWITPWVLADVRALPMPVAYRHPSGAVTWVNLDAEVAEAVHRQVVGVPAPATTKAAPPSATPKHSVDVRHVIVTGGNLRNGHLYVPLDFFPPDTIGGGNKATSAARTILVTFAPGRTAHTDIAGDKRILRDRASTGDFFASAGVQEGDVVRISRTGPYEYEIAKADDV